MLQRAEPSLKETAPSQELLLSLANLLEASRLAVCQALSAWWLLVMDFLFIL